MIIDAPGRGALPELMALWRQAFGDTDAYLDLFEKYAFSERRCRVVTDGGKLLGALYWFDCSYVGGRVAYLYAVATDKAHRGQGICRALMEDTHRHLESLGYVGAILVPGYPELFRFYEKLGYGVSTYVTEFEAYPMGRVTKLRKITPIEYARLRRELLPAGGVLQEEENIRFLGALSELYAGDGFILAASREGNILHCAELLGDTSAAPDIVRALGCEGGLFRAPGGGRAFSMFRPLSNKRVPVPSYFGLAFD